IPQAAQAAILNLNSPSLPLITAVTVAPGTAAVGVGRIQQFTATVQGTGSFSPAVIWLVNEVAGGNATVGTISATGLYTAPTTVPSANTVVVKAVSVLDATRNGTAAVTVGAITEVTVTPNPATVLVGQLQQFTATV